MKRYTTFEEIDEDLKYLRLKSKIDKEEVRLGIKLSKETLNETISPINIVAGTIGSIAKKAIVYKMVEKITGIKLRKKR